MGTPRHVNIVQIDGVLGAYWHQGLKFCLSHCFKNLAKDISISININIDGLPLYRSSNKNFWPILFNINEFPDIAPMAIGIFFGDSKPKNVTDYLEPFVEEIYPLLQNGVEVNGKKILVRIRCFICDSPARAFIKGTKNFNAAEGCQKCTIVGKYSYISNTVVFTKINQLERTNDMFRANRYTDHQKNETPLIRLPIDMIKDFVVADPLHLLELGVMKRLIAGWRKGDFGFQTKWSAFQQNEISEMLSKIEMPSEIHRDVRSLHLFNHWKGLEFRNFLNYYGIVVLQVHLPQKYYEHFLKLFCAVTICSAEKYLRHLNVAKLLFDEFVTEYKQIYGAEFLTSNVHNLVHVVDDVSRFGILSSISAYPFENALFTIKKMLRAGKNPLIQIANRLTERLFVSDFIYRENNECKQPAIRYGKNQKCEIETKEFKLSNVKFQDMWYNVGDKIFKMKNAVEINSEYFIEGREIEGTPLFEKPVKSTHFNIFVANLSDIGPMKRVNLKEVDCKFVAIRHSNEKFAFIPLLHTLKK